MRITLSVLLFVVALSTPASMMSNAVYQKSRAMERVVNALQVLGENNGYTEDQFTALTSVRDNLTNLYISLATEMQAEFDASSSPETFMAEYEQARALQRALSIMLLTSDVSGLTEEQVATFTTMRGSALGIVRGIKIALGPLE